MDLVPDGAHGAATDPMLEGFTSLGFVAAHTHSMRLGLLVTGVTYASRAAGQIVATLDVLSGGRAQLGIGAGWCAAPSACVAERFERPRRRCRSACRCGVTTMVRSKAGTTSSRRRCAHRADQCAPAAHPHRGGGERKTLRLVARPDACNLFAFDPDRPTSSRCSCSTAAPRAATPTRSSARSSSCATPSTTSTASSPPRPPPRLGVTTIDVVPTGDPVAFVERVGTELIPRLADLDTAA